MLWKFAKKAGVSVGDFTFARTFIMFILVFPLLLCTGYRPCKDMVWRLFPLVVARAFMGTMCFIGVTVSLTMMPLSLTTIIFNLAPFWGSIMACLIHKESISRVEYVAMLISFAGVVGMVLGPSENEDWPQLTLGIVIGLITSMGYAANNVMNRGLKKVHFSVVLFYHTLIGSILSLTIFGSNSLINCTPFLSNSKDGWIIILISGLIDFVCVASMIIAY